jgi:protein-tyrosine phosphatase
MVDTHCHLLPGLDDGPEDIGGALALARALVADGVGAVLATPHFSRRWPTAVPAAQAAADELRAALAAAGVPLRVVVAAEVAPVQAIQAEAAALRERAIGGRHVLVEVEGPTPAGVLGALVRRLAPMGLVAVIAHPERCRAVRRAPDLLDGPRHAGALVQVLAASLVGDLGPESHRCAWRLLDAGRADLVASDAHGTRHRPPRMSAAAALVERRLGPGTARSLFVERPAGLLGMVPGAAGGA